MGIRSMAAVLCLLLAGCATASSGSAALPSAAIEPAPEAVPAPKDIGLAIARLEAGTMEYMSRIETRVAPWGRRPRYSHYCYEWIVSRYEGSVLATDGTTNIHLVSRGSKDGAKVGDVVVLSRDGAAIAVAEVSMVFDNKAAIRLRSPGGRDGDGTAIRVGDRVHSGL
jgi:hypothetical protein